MSGGGDVRLLWLMSGAAALALLADLALSSTLAAVASMGRVALRRLVAESERDLAFAEEMASAPSSYRIVALLCRQISLLAFCGFATAAVALAGLPRPLVIGTAAAALLGVILIEGLASNLLALRHPRGVLLAVGPLLRALHALLAPPLAPLVAFAERVRAETPEGGQPGGEDEAGETEAFIEVAEKDGILEASESRMIRGIVDLGETVVREIMTPRPDVLAIPAELSVQEALRRFRSANHTRLPVYRQTLDEVVGILHFRDLLGAWEEGRENDPVGPHVRPAFFVPEILPVADLLAEMRTRTQIALVVDEYGGIAGLVTLEDVLEEIVGEIRDEHDTEESLVARQPDGSWLVSGSAHVEQLKTSFGLEIDEGREFDTVGGLVVSTLGRVPAEGDWLEFQGLKIEVVSADPRRVHRVRVVPPAPGPAAEERAD